MLANGWDSYIKKFCHSFLRTPNRFVMVDYLHAIFLPLNLKDQELRRAISMGMKTKRASV